MSYTFDWGDGSDDTVTSNPNNVAHTWTSAGSHTISVTAESQNGVSSEIGYHVITISNPAPVYHWLMVQATDFYNTLNPTIYLDDESIGTTPVTISVIEGWHYIDADSQTIDPWFYWDVYLQYINSDTSYYYGPGWIPIYEDTSCTAVYW